MKNKRNECIIDECDSKATCFYYFDGGYIPFCIDHFGTYTNNSSIDNKITHKKDLSDHIWRK